ncbi:50S ribosomal protein L25/general stress protein Ctc [Nakamurella lactea]|uniref:50S ribosomal protein L25/general stress protein Ctc n=1 Tax=Nakamurella lactea TaxID=459515 RepID=UPI000564B54E|nr:50S ribosomal protein L25/general stress protein Ctc [Nakamurella lactea]
MSETQTRLSAEVRTEFGKGFARRARKAGKIPAVLYGHGADPRHLSLEAREFARAIKGGANTILTLNLGDGEELALPKSVVRHPLKDYVEHVDLLVVRRGEKVTVDIQVHVTGEPVPGALVVNEQSVLSVEVDALQIPDRFEIDVTGAPVGTQFLAGQVAIGECTLVTDPEALMVAIQHAPTAEEVEASDAGAAAELGIEQDQPEAAEGEKSEGSES